MTARDALVGELAEAVVRTVAAEELVFFPAARDRFLARPRALAGARGEDDLLGYGAGELIALVTPVALFVASKLVERLTERAGDEAFDRGSAAVRRLFRRRRAAEPAVPSPPLEVTRDRLPEIRAWAEEAGLRAGLSRQRSEAVADAFLDAVKVIDE